MYLNGTAVLMGVGSLAKAGTLGGVWESNLINVWGLRLEHLISTGTAIHSAFNKTFLFRSQLLGRKEKVCSGWKIFLDNDLMPA